LLRELLDSKNRRSHESYKVWSVLLSKALAPTKSSVFLLKLIPVFFMSISPYYFMKILSGNGFETIFSGTYDNRPIIFYHR
jgi:hypothetical protein